MLQKKGPNTMKITSSKSKDLPGFPKVPEI
jgi:hypothetical protein